MIKKGCSRPIVGLSALCSLLLCTGPAYCQTAASTAAPGSQNAATPDNDNAEGQLAEVIVTAEIRQADPQTTPISLTTVSGAQLAAKQQVRIIDLQTTTPDFTVDSGGGNNNDVNIRGVGLPGIGATAGVTVGVPIMRDGLLGAESVGVSTTDPLYDIQSVTVLKGPQGTFVGFSAIGGAVQINSRDPVLSTEVSGYTEGLLGNYSDVKLDGAVNLPISSTFAMRVAFNGEARGSFYYDYGARSSNNVGTQETVTDPGNVNDRDVRVGLLWEPNSSFRALFKIAYDDSDTDGTGENINPATTTNPITGAVIHNPYFKYYTGQPFIAQGSVIGQRLRQVMQSNMLNLQYTLSDGVQLRSLSGFQNISVQTYQQSPLPIPVVSGYSDNVTAPNPYWSQEFDIISPTTWRVNYIVGAAWFHRSTGQDNNSYNELPPYSVANPQINQTVTGPYTSVQRTGGVFGQASWQIDPTLQLQLGLRENFDNNYNYGIYETIIPSPPEPVAPVIIPHYNIGHYHDSVPTGKLGLNWTPRAGQLLYVFYARGYKAGGVSTSGPNFGPEHVDDYELGWKGTMLDGHLVTDIDGFYMNYLDMQESVYNIGSAGTQLINLVGGSKIDGIEASLTGKFGRFGIDAGAAFLHSVLGTFRAVDNGELPSSSTGLIQCVGGAVPPSCFDYGPYTVTLSGEPNNLSPKYSGSLDLNYDVAIGDKVVTPQVTYQYTAQQYSSLFQQNDYYLMRAHGQLGANVTYVGGPWTLAAYGTNLGNKVYEVGNNGTAVFYANPRQFGLRFSRSY